MASPSSAKDSHSAPAPLKASLSSGPPIFLSFFRFYLPLNFATLFCLRPRSRLFLQELRSNFIILVNDKPGHFFGPMGDTDPTDVINLETGRIPFKHTSLNLAD
jgi:hypothetical protein